MGKKPARMMAPCGLDCLECDIRRAKSEPDTMREILEWFARERGIELRPEQVDCGGCLGDRSAHWSPDCRILKCSVDERGLSSCSKCGEFPCSQLETWASRSPRYAEGLARLKEMRRLAGT